MRKSRDAKAKGSPKPHLYLHTVVENGSPRLRAVATDGTRLALAEMLAPEGAVGGPGVIIPRKTVQEARRLLEDAGESVELSISPQKVRFEFGRAALTSKVIDGAFPDYVGSSRARTTGADGRQ